MKVSIRNLWAKIVPFVTVLVLWRLVIPFWNPGGILAMIPIFYYSFIHPTPWFAPYAAIFCFLIDYTSDTVLYWTALYCAAYAANGFQHHIDLSRWDRGGVRAFIPFFSVGMMILFLSDISVDNLIRTLWTIAWGCVLYTPIIALTRGRQ